MSFIEKIIIIILFLPLIGLGLYMIFYPRDSALLGKRWQFKNEDLEPSEEAIKYNRNSGIVMLIVIGIILIFTIFR